MNDDSRSTRVPPTDRNVPPELSALYKEVILDHYRRPRNRGALEGATHSITLNNPLCGDVIDLMLKLESGRVVDARFAGHGCSISLASASMMTAKLKGRTLAQARELAAKFTRLLHGDAEMARDRELGDLRAMSGVSKFPVRIKCALLGWNCLEELLGSEPGCESGERTRS
ncbi:MAG: Fe-S cluster assembly sulfur transfer protein SufU [Gemmatimonadota bacterium]